MTIKFSEDFETYKYTFVPATGSYFIREKINILKDKEYETESIQEGPEEYVRIDFDKHSSIWINSSQIDEISVSNKVTMIDETYFTTHPFYTFGPPDAYEKTPEGTKFYSQALQCYVNRWSGSIGNKIK